MKRTFAIMFIAFVLGGCATGVRYTKAEPKVPEGWISEQAVGVSATPAATAAWWTLLKDPTLTSLVERVAKANYDVRLAEARIREARGARDLVGSTLMPGVNTSASWTASRQADMSVLGGGNFGQQAGPAAALGGLSGGGGQGGFKRRQNLFRAGFDANWEIDIFGGTRAEVKAAKADLRASEEQRRAVLVTATAEVALAYVDLRGAQRRREIVDKNIAAQENSVRITRERFRVGISSEFDAARAETLLSTLRAQVPQIEEAIKMAMYRIALIAGETPGALTAKLEKAMPLPATPTEIQVGLPSDLLRRRADVRAAEEALRASEARIKVAEALLFPKFFLNSSLSGQGQHFGDLFTPEGLAWSFAPSVEWHILQAGNIRANIEVQNARQEAAAIGYEKTVAMAVDEVERALTAYAKETAHRGALQTVVDGHAKSVTLANERYLRGMETFLNVLSAQQEQYAAEADLVGSETEALTNLIAVYKALGGGWEEQTVIGSLIPDNR